MIMSPKPNVSYTIKHNLCLGCGLCADVCPTSSIKIRPVNGEYRPVVDFSTCNNSKGCHCCSMVCPGIGINLAQIGKEKYGNNPECKFHKLVGYYSNAYSGYALDYETRFHAASGGLLTAFTAYIDNGAVASLVVYDDNTAKAKIRPESYVLVFGNQERGENVKGELNALIPSVEEFSKYIEQVNADRNEQGKPNHYNRTA